MSSSSSSSSDSDSIESGEEEQQVEEQSPAENNRATGAVTLENEEVNEDSPIASRRDEDVQSPGRRLDDKEGNTVEAEEGSITNFPVSDATKDDLFEQESSDDSEGEIGQGVKKSVAEPVGGDSDSDAPRGVASDDQETEKSATEKSDQAFAATEEDLFGDAADLSSSDNEERKQNEEGNEEMTEDDIVGPRMYMEEDEEEEKQAPVETVINVEAPRINADLGNQIHFVKFPNFLSVEPRVFDAETYEDEIDEDEVLDEEGRSRLKLKVENTIRWRNATDEYGNPTKESNAKIVRWSDGTLSLYLGSEIFDVHMQPTVGDHNHLFVRQGQGLQGQAVFRTKLTFRPHSTDTLTHRKMTLSMADRSSKAQKVKVLAEVGNDPETQKQELVRKEEERLRASARRECQQRRIRERTMNRGLSAGFLEPDRDEDSDEDESLAAIKRSFKPGGREFDRTVRGLRGSESDDSEESKRRPQGAKRLESDEDDKSPDDASKKKPKVIEDSDEDDN